MNKNLKELLILHFFNDGMRSAATVLLPFIATDLSITLGQVGLIGSSLPLMALIFALPVSFFASKWGGFQMLSYLLVLYSIGTLLIAFSPTFLILIGGFFLGAIGFGMFHPVGFALVAKSSNDTNIGRNMGDFSSIGEIGRIALPPLAIFATSLVGWRPTVFTLAILGFIVFIIVRMIKNKEAYKLTPQKETHESYKDFLKATALLLKSKKLLLIIGASIFDAFASSPIYLFLPFLLLAKGMTLTELGILTACFFIGSFLGKILLGRGVDKIGNAKVFIISELCMAVVLVAITTQSLFPMLLFLSLLLGIFTKGTSPVVQTMFSKISHRDHYHKTYAISEMSITSASALILLVAGFIADAHGTQMVYYLSAFFAVLATLPIIPLALKK